MSKLLIGGQAVVEGVMMRSPTHMAVAVRTPKGTISTMAEKIPLLGNKYPIFKLPFIRGTAALYDTLIMGFKALIYSTNESSEEDEQLTRKDIFFAMLISFAFAMFLFVAVPFAGAHLIFQDDIFLFNLIDGLFRLLVFFGYLVVISMFKDVQRLFQYHGAEHMTVHAYEHDKSLTLQNVRKFRTMHPRCGTSFLMLVFATSIIVFSIITPENIFVRFLSRIILIPVVAGISYELLRLSAKHEKNLLMQIVIAPGIFLQYITTKRPNDKQIEVAIKSLKTCLKVSR